MISDLTKELEKQVNKFKRKVNNLEELNNLVKKYGCTLGKKFNKDEAITYIKTVVKILKENKQVFIENDVKTYLNNVSSLCGKPGRGGASFLNNQITTNLKEKFFDDFEKPIVEMSNKQDKKHLCIFCGTRPAKKGAMFNTGIVSFLGANEDNKNFFWNFKPRLPICEICELIYFCIFAGLTEFRKFRIGQTKRFYFVDRNTSVLELYRTNKLFMEKMSKEENILKEKGILNFLNDYLLLKLREESKFTLANILFIEIDLTTVAPKLYGFSISKQKAEFITSNYEMLEKITGNYVSINDNVLYPFGEFMQKVFE